MKECLKGHTHEDTTVVVTGLVRGKEVKAIQCDYCGKIVG